MADIRLTAAQQAVVDSEGGALLPARGRPRCWWIGS